MFRYFFFFNEISSFFLNGQTVELSAALPTAWDVTKNVSLKLALQPRAARFSQSGFWIGFSGRDFYPRTLEFFQIWGFYTEDLGFFETWGFFLFPGFLSSGSGDFRKFGDLYSRN